MAVLASVPFLAAARLARTVGAEVGSGAVFVDPWSALFEAMSAVTSTGLTMVEAESELPHALQWWRSVLEWSGGAGVVVFVLALTAGDGGYRLYEAEGRRRLLRNDVHATARRLWRILLGLTVLSVLALLAAGVEPWVALNHGLAGISTGGMVVTDDSFTGTSAPVRLVGMAVMVLGAMSYGSLGLLLRRDTAAFLRLTQVRALAVALLGGGVAVLVTLRVLGVGPGVLDAAFLWVSALTTCGFSTTPVPELPAATVLLLLAGMFVGGSAGSTTGGIKLRRAAWLGRPSSAVPSSLPTQRTAAAAGGWTGSRCRRTRAPAQPSGPQLCSPRTCSASPQGPCCWPCRPVGPPRRATCSSR